MNKKKLPGRLKQKYKLVVLDDDTFEEKVSFTARLWFLLTGAFSGAVVIIIVTIILIKITPLREYLGGMDYQIGSSGFVKAYQRIDSLEKVSTANALFLENLQQVMGGEAGETIAEASERDRSASEQEPSPTVNTSPTGNEQALQSLIAMGAAQATAAPVNTTTGAAASYAFMSPAKGMLSAGFDLKSAHDAVDIAVVQDEPVRATLDGHVLFASYTPETGYVMMLQHADNFVSVYKHCAALLKKVGSFVRKGDVIALAGNTGELSTGPHLHFELWHNGTAVNPREYMTF